MSKEIISGHRGYAVPRIGVLFTKKQETKKQKQKSRKQKHKSDYSREA